MLLQRYLRPTWWLLTIPLGVVALIGCGHWIHSHPDGMTGGSTLGLWCGLGALLCMALAFVVLPAQRRRAAFQSAHSSRAYWLQGHIWLSFLAAALVLGHTAFCQGGVRLGGRLETVLLVLFGLTYLTGFIGLLLQNWVPRLLTRATPNEIPVGQGFRVCQVWRHQADRLIEAMAGSLPEEAHRRRLQETYLRWVRPFLYEDYPWRLARFRPWAREERLIESLLAERARDSLSKEWTGLQAIHQDRRRLLRQQRQHWWLHIWLLLHVPLAVALLFLTLVHALVLLTF